MGIKDEISIVFIIPCIACGLGIIINLISTGPIIFYCLYSIIIICGLIASVYYSTKRSWARIEKQIGW